jgi:hypothetical protein
MSIKEILEELPKLTEEEKRQLWNVLDHELTPEEDEESPEVLAAIDEGIRSLLPPLLSGFQTSEITGFRIGNGTFYSNLYRRPTTLETPLPGLQPFKAR